MFQVNQATVLSQIRYQTLQQEAETDRQRRQLRKESHPLRKRLGGYLIDLGNKLGGQSYPSQSGPPGDWHKSATAS